MAIESTITIAEQNSYMLGEALRLLRVFNDLKAKELAVDLGISPSYLSELENSKKKPSLEVINRYSEVFKIKSSAILSLSEELAIITDRKSVAEKLIKYLKVIE